MKKIMFFNRTFFAGGVEKALLDIIKNIADDEHDITLFVRRFEGDLMPQYIALESEHIHIRKCFDHIKPGKTIIKKAYNATIIWLAEKCICKFPKIYYMIAIKDKFDVEVAYMHNEATAIIASSTNRESRKVAWVHTDLRQIKTWKDYFGSRRKQKKYYNRFDKIVCVSNLVKNCFEELLGSYKDVEVIFNPVDEVRINRLSEEKFNFAKRNKIICAVGRLSYEKNFDMLIRVHALLLKLGVKQELWFVGDGPQYEKLECLVTELGVCDSVIFWGFQDNPYKFIKASEITVLCSLYEGLPVVALETTLLHKPMVSCCDVVREVFGNYDCGIITEKNEESLASAMRKLLTNADLYDRCVSGAISRSKELTLEATIDSIRNAICR